LEHHASGTAAFGTGAGHGGEGLHAKAQPSKRKYVKVAWWLLALTISGGGVRTAPGILLEYVDRVSLLH